MQEWNKDQADATYRFSKWGMGYFDVSPSGDLCILPNRGKTDVTIKITDVVNEIEKSGITLPAVLRFHDILRSEVKHLNKIFRKTIAEANYQGQYFGVYPIKVNQMREVVEEILDAGQKDNVGLEAGSKAEILAALSLNHNPKSLTILNGYKDEEYFRLAMIGRKIGKEIIIVIEKLSELKQLIKVSKEMKVTPLIGLRAKLSTKGSGRWVDSSGDRAKFGLTTSEILEAIEILKEERLVSSFKLFHFHLGSQINDIQSIKSAVTEGARIYAQLRKMGLSIEYFDVGGGLAVDYMGHSSAGTESSRNYQTKDYVADVIYRLQEICDLENIPHPHIVSESGRAITAHHSCVILDVFGEINPNQMIYKKPAVENEHYIVQGMRDILDNSGSKNHQETLNDALERRKEAFQAFNLGILTLQERATVEQLYWEITHHLYKKTKDKDDLPANIQNLSSQFQHKYLCNFSVFQSAADCWAIDQVLPIMPISRLNERPEVECTLADITCDSDGKISHFQGDEGPEDNLLLHKLIKNEPYKIALFMTGAYQDIMGDNHNLFGRLNEVHVFQDDDDPSDFYIEEIIPGNSAADVLKTMQYSPREMAQTLKRKIDKKVQAGEIRPREGVALTDFYEKSLSHYTYLMT